MDLGFDSLMAVATLTHVDSSAAFDHLASLIDGSHDERREDGLDKKLDVLGTKERIG